MDRGNKKLLEVFGTGLWVWSGVRSCGVNVLTMDGWMDGYLYVSDVASRDVTQLGLFYNAPRFCILSSQLTWKFESLTNSPPKDALVTN